MPAPYIQVSDNFVSLKDVKNINLQGIEDTELTFHVKYKINQTDIINSNLTRVTIKIYNKISPEPTIFNPIERGLIGSANLIDAILSQRNNSYQSFLRNQQQIISQNTSSTTSRFNHGLIKRGSTTSIGPTQIINEDVGKAYQLSDVITNNVSINNDVEISTEVKILMSNIRSRAGLVFVTFEAIDGSKNQILETISRQIDIYKHLDLWKIPTLPPVVSSSFNKKEKIIETNLSIKQVDKSANLIKIYRKTMFSNSESQNSYEFLGDFLINRNQIINLKFNHLVATSVNYRIIPCRDQKVGSVYTDVFYRDKFYAPKLLSLTSRIIGNGIKLEARKISEDVISIQFLRKNLSLKEKIFKAIGPSQMRSSGQIVSYIDSNLIDGHVYEYSTRCLHKNSIRYECGNDTCRYLRVSPGLMSISTEGISVDDIPAAGTLDISFGIKILMDDSSLSKIKNSLERSGIKEYFNQNIEDSKNDLNSILFFHVERINLNTGDKEFLGIYSYDENFRFSDASASRKFGASNLKRGDSYRYVINGIMWNADVISSVSKKKKKDPSTGMTYSYSPQKWGMPSSLKDGTILALTNNMQLERGMTGNFIYFDVSLNGKNEIFGINSVNAELFDDSRILIRWDLTPGNDLIDHFMIFDVSNTSIPPKQIGIAHAQSEYFNREWIHEISIDANGKDMLFSIVPVNSFGEKMQEATSNTIRVS